MLDAQLDIAQKNVKLNDSTLRIIRLQYDAGQVTSLSCTTSRGTTLAAAQLVPVFEQNIAIQENALRILTGALPDKIERQPYLRSD
jgi:multidrug efflux system outer membrane protein